MRKWKLSACVLLAVSGMVLPARAQDSKCRNVAGRLYEVQIPSQTDPFGRVMGFVSGVLEGTETSILTGPPGSLEGGATPTYDVFLTRSGDVLAATGVAFFVPTDKEGVVTDNLTLTVVSGSGKFAGATGTINVTGEGFNVFPPGDPRGGPGLTYFTLQYRGSVCVP